MQVSHGHRRRRTRVEEVAHGHANHANHTKSPSGICRRSMHMFSLSAVFRDSMAQAALRLPAVARHMLEKIGSHQNGEGHQKHAEQLDHARGDASFVTDEETALMDQMQSGKYRSQVARSEVMTISLELLTAVASAGLVSLVTFRVLFSEAARARLVLPVTYLFTEFMTVAIAQMVISSGLVWQVGHVQVVHAALNMRPQRAS